MTVKPAWSAMDPVKARAAFFWLTVHWKFRVVVHGLHHEVVAAALPCRRRIVQPKQTKTTYATTGCGVRALASTTERRYCQVHTARWLEQGKTELLGVWAQSSTSKYVQHVQWPQGSTFRKLAAMPIKTRVKNTPRCVGLCPTTWETT